MIFTKQGYPTIVKTDNGPPFHGQEFIDFATQSDFRHRRIISLLPEANGEGKRLVRPLKSIFLPSLWKGLTGKPSYLIF